MMVHPSLLLVEDDLYAQRLVSAVAERAGYEVTVVGLGESAKEAADTIPIDIIVVDLKLPDAEGLELIAHLRAKPQLLDVPFLVCSGNVSVETVTEAARLGALEFLRKPIDLTELQKRLERSHDMMPDRWIQARVKPVRSPQDRQQATEHLAAARAQIETLVSRLDTQATGVAEKDATLAEQISTLHATALDIGAPRLKRIVSAFEESTDGQALNIGLRIALASIDQRLAS